MFEYFIFLRLFKGTLLMNAPNITQYLLYLDIKLMDLTINTKQLIGIC